MVKILKNHGSSFTSLFLEPAVSLVFSAVKISFSGSTDGSQMLRVPELGYQGVKISADFD